MTKEKLELITIRVNMKTLKELEKALGVDTSKCIRACMNVTKNVILNLFGGEIQNIFKRKKDNEEIALYDESI